MSVTSSKLSSIPFKGYDGADLSIIVKTANQSHKNQPLLWTVHGSGGVSSSDELWQAEALQRGFSIAWVDHYSPRGIYKLNHRPDEPHGIWSVDMAADICLAKKALDCNRKLLPYLCLDGIRLVGFSSGGTAAMYATMWQESQSWIAGVAALYPGLWPITDLMTKANGRLIRIYVGSEDDWTPARHAIRLSDILPDLEVIVLDGIKHSFSKPGAGGYYDGIARTSDIAFPIPVPMSDVRNRSGEYARLLSENRSNETGVHAMYDHQATMYVIDDFLGVVRGID